MESMERHGHLYLDPRVLQRLLAASAATLDRLLQPIRTPASRRLRRRRNQTPGRNIPVRTFADWNAQPPGVNGGCKVGHVGGSPGVRKRPFCSPHRGWLFGPGGGFPADSPREELSRTRDPSSGRRHSIGIHSNGMGTIPMQCIAIHSIPMDSNRLLSAEGNGLGKTTNESGGAFTTIPVTPQITWR